MAGHKNKGKRSAFRWLRFVMNNAYWFLAGSAMVLYPFLYAYQRDVSWRLVLVSSVVSILVNGVWQGVVMARDWSPLLILVTFFAGFTVIGYPVQLFSGVRMHAALLAWIFSYNGGGMFLGSRVERLLRRRKGGRPGGASGESLGPVCLLRPDVGVVVGEFEVLCGRGRGLLSVFLDGGVRCDVGCAGPESFVVFFTSHRLRDRALLEDVWQGTSATASGISGDDDEVVPVNFWGADGRSPFPDRCIRVCCSLMPVWLVRRWCVVSSVVSVLLVWCGGRRVWIRGC